MNEQNIHLYRIFNEVAKAGNITHAAKNLYISQPAVSSAINNLESSLGVTLFIRKSRGVELTEKGEMFYRHVRSAFDILEQGEFELRRTEKLRIGRLSIGLSTTMCHFVVRPFLKKFIEEHPYIDLSLINQSSYKTFSMLEEYEVDIGITTEPMRRNTFEYFPFMEYEYIFVATPGYLNTLKLRQAEGVADYFALGTLLLLHKMHPVRQSVDQYFYENGYKVGHTLEVSNMDLLIDFSNMGMGIGYVIRNFVLDQLESGELIELPLELPRLERNFGLSYNKSAHLTSEMAAFIESFKRVYELRESPEEPPESSLPGVVRNIGKARADRRNSC